LGHSVVATLLSDNQPQLANTSIEPRTTRQPSVPSHDYTARRLGDKFMVRKSALVYSFSNLYYKFTISNWDLIQQCM